MMIETIDPQMFAVEIDHREIRARKPGNVEQVA